MRNVFNRWTLCLLVCLSIFVMSLVFFIKGFDSDKFIVPKDDKSAIYGLKPVIADELNYTVLDDASIPFSFGLCANPIVDGGDLVVWFNNPKDNESWLLLRAYSEDKLLGSSGVIKEGGFVEKIHGNFDNVSDVTFKILAYEPFLYYSNGTVSVDVMVNR